MGGLFQKGGLSPEEIQNNFQKDMFGLQLGGAKELQGLQNQFLGSEGAAQRAQDLQLANQSDILQRYLADLASRENATNRESELQQLQQRIQGDYGLADRAAQAELAKITTQSDKNLQAQLAKQGFEGEQSAAQRALEEALKRAELGSQESMLGKKLASEEKLAGMRLDQINKLGDQARGDMTASEQNLLSALNGPSSELDQLKQDIASQNARTMQDSARQMQANLYTSGVRGGQAATLMNRGMGQLARNAQSDINQLQYNDRNNKRNMLGNYFANNAAASRNALYSLPRA